MKRFFERICSEIIIFIILCFLAQPFIRSVFLLIITAGILSFAVSASFRGFSRTARISFIREQLKSFLEILIGRLSSGRTIEHAVADTCTALKEIYDSDSAIMIGLERVKSAVNTGGTYPQVLTRLGSALPCPEASALFESLSGMRQTGDQYIAIIRQSLLMVSELMTIHKDISAEVSRKRLESLIMSCMPFLVAFSLDIASKDYLDTAFHFPVASFFLWLSYVLSVLSYCLAVFFISDSVRLKDGKKVVRLSISISSFYHMRLIEQLLSISTIRTFINFFIRFLPKHYLLQKKRILLYLYPDMPQILDRYLVVHCGICIIMIVIGCSMIFFTPIPFYLPMIGLATYLASLDYDLKKQIDDNRYAFLCNLPGFVALLTTLLSSGMLLPRALDLCMSTFARTDRVLEKEFSYMKSSIDAGSSHSDALERFSDRCQIPEISNALLLASRYGRNGHTATLHLLLMQQNACWIQLKVSAKKNLEYSGMKLLFPMMLQMICVIVISVLPAVCVF